MSPIFSDYLFELARKGELRLSGRIARLYPFLAVLYALVVPLFTSILAAIPLGLLLFLSGSSPLDDQSLYNSAYGLTAILVLGFGPIFILVGVWVWLFERRRFWTLGLERRGWLPKYLRGGWWGLVMISTSIGLPALLGYVKFDWGDERLGFMLGSASVVLVGWIVQGAAEEILFRGFIFQITGVRFGMGVGIVVSSLLFTLLHVFNPNIGPVSLVNLALFGVFAVLYALNEGSLWGIFAIHSIWNWAQASLFGVQVSGIQIKLESLLTMKEAGPAWLTGGAFGPEGGVAVTVVLLAGILLLVARTRR